MLKPTLSLIFLAVLRCRRRYTPAVAKLCKGRAILIANHVSLLDGILIALVSPVPLAFGVDTSFSRHNRWTAFGLKLLSKIGYGWVIPLDSSSPFGLRRLRQYLNDCHAVMLFPEGKISLDGCQQVEQPGIQWLAKQTGAAIIRASIHGAERSRFFSKSGTDFWPRIEVVI